MGYFNALYAAELPHRDVAVYMYLKHRANAEGRCWPSVRTIAKDLSLSRATVQRALRELQQNRWIAADPRWRENGSCTSKIVWRDCFKSSPSQLVEKRPDLEGTRQAAKCSIDK